MRTGLVAILVLTASCGSAVDEGPKGASGVASSKHLWELSGDEVTRYCDWLYGANGVIGRYDQPYTCNGFMNRTPTRDQCVSARAPQKAGCTWTIGNAEACALAVKNPCMPVPPPEECVLPDPCR